MTSIADMAIIIICNSYPVFNVYDAISKAVTEGIICIEYTQLAGLNITKVKSGIVLELCKAMFMKLHIELTRRIVVNL